MKFFKDTSLSKSSTKHIHVIISYRYYTRVVNLPPPPSSSVIQFSLFFSSFALGPVDSLNSILYLFSCLSLSSLGYLQFSFLMSCACLFMPNPVSKQNFTHLYSHEDTGSTKACSIGMDTQLNYHPLNDISLAFSLLLPLS